VPPLHAPLSVLHQPLSTLLVSMSNTVISVENVTKTYRLGQIGGGTLKGDVARWWAMLRGQPDPNLKIGEEHHARKMGDQFWALQDVSFEVKEGEVLGIIGRNGAGKSTLLKILSQVTTPTSGQIKIKGRIASLLEVGTGFNPEMTGRENIFLNGAILGMTKAEIRKKFDEIVAFSGIEEFIDTPVKRYSSGMYVRLAFAVAAHLESEILILDEVLAVGDSEFQKKCLGKMDDVSKSGRTILFVSHNMTAMRALCNQCVLMWNGKVVAEGNAGDVIQQHLGKTVTGHFIREAQANGQPTITEGRIVYPNEEQKEIHINLEVTAAIEMDLSVDVRVIDSSDMPVGFASVGTLDYRQLIRMGAGKTKLSFCLDVSQLAVGDYKLSFDLTVPNSHYLDRINNILSLEVVRIPQKGVARVFEQRWGYGSYEMRILLLSRLVAG
jgi:lipopolysaccharide transport system ATP-binding protein